MDDFDPRKLIGSWIRDAHAMEVALEKVLRRQADRATDNPVLRSAILNHADVTHSQASRLQEQLNRYGDRSSFLKDMAASMTGYLQGASMWPMDDSPVKDVLMGLGAEHFEVACYRALETAAEAIGDAQLASLAHDIRQEEQEYLRILEEILPEVVRRELHEPVHT